MTGIILYALSQDVYHMQMTSINVANLRDILVLQVSNSEELA